MLIYSIKIVLLTQSNKISNQFYISYTKICSLTDVEETGSETLYEDALKQTGKI